MDCGAGGNTSPWESNSASFIDRGTKSDVDEFSELAQLRAPASGELQARSTGAIARFSCAVEEWRGRALA